MASELELRTCGRAGCRWPASATLSFRYETGQVWLMDLAPEPHPSLYDLCPHHADTLTVPRGWERVDERSHREAVREPAGRDLGAPARPEPAPDGNRYAALVEELPRLAREHGVEESDADVDAGQPHAPPRAAGPEPAPVDGPPAGVVPSRELAPLPVEPARASTGGARPDEAGAEAEGTSGQLAIAVDGVEEVEPGEATVVSIETASTRRRERG